MGLYLGGPLVTQVVIQIACDINSESSNNSVNDDDCNSSAISAQAALVSLYSTLAGNIPSLLLAGTYASVADRYGRKITMILPLVGYIIYFVTLFVIALLKPTFYLYMIIGASFLTGLLGSYSTYFMAAFTYIADTTKLNTGSRAFAFSLLEGSVFFAKVTGPLAGGFWAEYDNFSSPILAGACLCGVALLWIYFIPESLPIDAASRKQPLVFDPFKTVRNLYLLVALQPQDGSASPLPWVSFAFFLFYIANISNLAIEAIYFKHLYKWGPEIIGIYVATEGFIQTFSMVLVPALFYKVTTLIVHDIFWILTSYLARCSTSNHPFSLSLFSLSSLLCVEFFVLSLMCCPWNLFLQ